MTNPLTDPIPPSFDRTRWLTFEDTVRRFAPYLDVTGLHRAIESVRPSEVDEHGARGEWAHQVPYEDLEARREALLYELVDLAEEKTGQPWPFVNDHRPAVPDDLSGLAI